MHDYGPGKERRAVRIWETLDGRGDEGERFLG
jgi:hypothetical protein